MIMTNTVIQKIPKTTTKYAKYKSGDPNIAKKLFSLSIREISVVRRRNLLIIPMTRAAI